jgi:hypothetical protein
LPLSADDIVEFHAARLLLLLDVCGISGRIDGLTKMAKLDFFARYPAFFDTARTAVAPNTAASTATGERFEEIVESAMVRHHYGPWDKRYYHVLAYLESRSLITVAKSGKSYKISLTESGRHSAKALEARSSFGPLVIRMREIKAVFGNKSGTFLKDLIYRLFDIEVGRRPLGEVIHR